MLGNSKVVASFSVDDVPKAQSFYAEKLGLKTSGESGALFLHLSGGQDVLIYPKPDHIPASFTLLNFVVDDIDAAVDALSASGVRFLRYDEYGADEKGIVRGPERDMAWFTDPAGNNHAVAHPKTPSRLQENS